MQKLRIVIIAAAAFVCGFSVGYYCCSRIYLSNRNLIVGAPVQTEKEKPPRDQFAARVKELQREIEEKDSQIGVLRKELSTLRDILNEIRLAEQPKETPVRTEKKPGDTGVRKTVPEDPDLAKLAREAAADPLNRELARRYLAEAARSGAQAREDAVEIYKEAAKTNPESADAHYNLGMAYIEQLTSMRGETSMEAAIEIGELALRAVEEFGKALEIRPDDYDALLARGVTYYHFPGKMKEAVGDLEKLVDMTKDKPLEDRHALGYLWLGRAYKGSGNKGKALETLREGCRLFPQDETLQRELLGVEKE